MEGISAMTFWRWIKRVGRWLADRAKDLFYSVGNEHLDLARVVGAIFAGLAAFALFWNALHLGKEIDLAAFLGGLTALAGGIAALIATKDWARRKAEPPQETYESTVKVTKASEPAEGAMPEPKK